MGEKELLDIVSADELVLWLLRWNEKMAKLCHAESVERGRLCKGVRVLDMAFAKLPQDRAFFSALGKASRVSSYLYPQLIEVALLFVCSRSIFHFVFFFLQVNVVLNPPSLVHVMLKIASSFLSPSTMSKVKICQGNTLTGNVLECPFASARFKKEDLPSFMGGSCSCRKGCVQNVNNSVKLRKDPNLVPSKK